MKKTILFLGVFLTLAINAWSFTAKRADEVDMHQWEETASYYFSTKDENSIDVKSAIYNALDNLETSLLDNGYSIEDFNYSFAENDNGMWVFYSYDNKAWFSISIHEVGKDDYYMWYIQYRRKLKKHSISKAGDITIAEGDRAGVNTASSRASDAKEDFTWDD